MNLIIINTKMNRYALVDLDDERTEQFVGTDGRVTVWGHEYATDVEIDGYLYQPVDIPVQQRYEEVA